MIEHKHVSFRVGRDAHVVINEVAQDFPEVAVALDRLDARVLQDFSNALSHRMNWSMAEMFSHAANGLRMDVLEGFANTAHLVDSRRLDDFSRAVSHLEADPVLSDFARVVEDMREILSLIAESKRGLAEASTTLGKLDVVTLAAHYSQQEAAGKRQHAAHLKKLEQQVHDWRVRCLCAAGVALFALLLLAR